ncbi:hypothetical protein [Nocardia sp. CDC153]|uniref:hypothetical protein n=1 Tax=Nocardia sp. CDC153 TaxID=3112167 RepID=UPI003FA3480E
MLARRGYTSATAYAAVSAELTAWAEAEQPSLGRGSALSRRARVTAGREFDSDPGPGAVDAEDSALDENHAVGTPDSPSLDDDRERAADLVRTKLRSLPRDLDREKTIRRLVGLLARRGFTQSLAYSVVKDEMACAAREDG